MNWWLSKYNLIVYGHTHSDIFRHMKGPARFDRTRLFEYTSRTRSVSVSKLAERSVIPQRR